MEIRKAEHSSTDTFRQPHHHHHHHQILLPCHHHHHQQQQNRLPCHHHHHHVVLLPHCCAVHGFVLPPNGPPVLRPIDPCTPQTITQLQPSFGDQENQSSQVFEQEDAFEELEEEEEEEEDPIFVLTDEWRDFFAKSEAKRRQAKKQARKQAKK